MKLAVIGTGYVGLVAGVCFADTGNDVICVDKQESIVSQLQQGKPTIYEDGLAHLLERGLQKNNISFTTDLAKAVQQSNIIFIAVNTPMGDDGKADLTAVKTVATQIAKAINAHKIIVTKSTVPVGTGDVIEQILKKETTHSFDVISNPEFMKEGAAIADFTSPDRVVIGMNKNHKKIESAFSELYAPFMRKSDRILFMNRASAELCKYGANAMLATRISFMNELSRIAEKTGANITDIRKAMGADSRIGPAFLFPGPGYGGSCFPKDVEALVYTANEVGEEFQTVQAAQNANKKQRQHILNKILTYYKDVSGKTFAVWGLSFKARTDDVRMSAAIEIIQQLLQKGAKVQVYDPEAMQKAKEVLGASVTYATSEYDVLKDAHALIIMTEWNEFRTPNFEKIMQLKDKTIIDARNLYSLQNMKKLGFTYLSVGRPNV